MRSYSELVKLPTFEERLEYLRLWDDPHTSPRATSMSLYKSKQWLATRDAIIRRDFGSDLGILGVEIFGAVYVHHINPITDEDIENWSYKLFDPENLISSSLETHNSIHYKPSDDPYVERSEGDTKLW